MNYERQVAAFQALLLSGVEGFKYSDVALMHYLMYKTYLGGQGFYLKTRFKQRLIEESGMDFKTFRKSLERLKKKKMIVELGDGKEIYMLKIVKLYL